VGSDLVIGKAGASQLSVFGLAPVLAGKAGFSAAFAWSGSAIWTRFAGTEPYRVLRERDLSRAHDDSVLADPQRERHVRHHLRRELPGLPRRIVHDSSKPCPVWAIASLPP
jgi:hypothetical protein